MHLLLIFITFFAVSQAATITEIEETTLWNSFKNDHNKQYSTVEEENHRFGVFKDNVAMINKHNLEADMGLHSYRVKINQFADMTKQEISEKVLSELKTPSRKPRGRPFEIPDNMELPESVDWREKGAVIDVIEDQLACGSCWAFTATGALEGQHFLKTGNLVRLSAQNLMDCSDKFGNMGCNGGLMDASFQYIKANKGIDTAASYPYEAKTGVCRFNRSNVAATATGFVDLPVGNETALQIAIANIGPISVAVDGSHSGFAYYSSGVYDEPACSTTQIDHSFVLVGYGTFNNGTTKKEYYIAKNSWGKSWGMNGYILMSRNNKNQCGIANIGSYPTV